MSVNLIINNIIYNNVESISIPKVDGGTAKFYLYSYTNQVPISIGTDKKVYNGTGWKEGYRLSASSGNESDVSGKASITGFIPCKAGDVVRFQYTGENKVWEEHVINSGYNIVAYYDTSFGWLGSCCPLQGNGVVYGICTKNDIATFSGGVANDGIVEFIVPNNTNIQYLRISLSMYDTTQNLTLKNLIVTVNEEIE